jgi:hypothetical protein
MFASASVGITAFCLTLSLTLFLGGVVLDLPQGHAFFSPQDVMLLFISLLAGLIIAIISGVKYYRYLGKARGAICLTRFSRALRRG